LREKGVLPHHILWARKGRGDPEHIKPLSSEEEINNNIIILILYFSCKGLDEEDLKELLHLQNQIVSTFFWFSN
jgi:hypothetical protein